MLHIPTHIILLILARVRTSKHEESVLDIPSDVIDEELLSSLAAIESASQIVEGIMHLFEQCYNNCSQLKPFPCM